MLRTTNLFTVMATVMAALVVCLLFAGCSVSGTEGESDGSAIDGGSLDSVGDGTSGDVIILDGGCTPGTPISHEDPCLVCACGDDGVATCEPATAGVACGVDDCCVQAPTCQPCEGDDCPVSGMACTGEPLFTCADENQCTEDRAVCTDGVCACESVVSEDGASCVVDANACTVGDTCQEGVCVQGDELDMEDGNPCTTGVCVKGQVEQKALEGPCSDGDPCTVGDTCVLAQCVPDALKECPELPCAESGWCDSDVGDCVYDFKADGTACEIDSACGGEGVCTSGQCELENNPCDDLNPCTADICGDDGGCQNLPLEDGSLCEDSTTCTVSTCKSGLCQAVPGAGCDDGNPCTADECDDSGACVNTPIDDGAPCGDDDVCTGEELCEAGSCETTPPVECVTLDPCAPASCHPQIGCVIEPKADGEPCGDDDVCNGEELCNAGICEVSDALDCTSDDPCQTPSCDPQLGCVFDTIPGCGDDPACTGHFGVLDGATCIMVPHALDQMPPEFTVEFWVRPDAAPNAPSLFDKVVDSDWSNPGWRIQYNANGPPYAESIHYQEINLTGGANGMVTLLETFPVGSWNHFAVSRSANKSWGMYVNGVLVGTSAAADYLYVEQSNGDPLWIGCSDFEKAFFPGAFDEIRVSNIARYAGPFEPPTEPLDVDENTILLFDFDQLEGGTVIDSSGNGYHGTIMGTPIWEAGGPVAETSCDDGDPCTSDACDTGACVHTPIPDCGDTPECPSHAAVFDGASCIEVPGVLNPMPASYTIEMWFYAESAEHYQRILDKIVDGDSNQPGFQVSYNDFTPLLSNLHYQEVKLDGNFHGVMTGADSVPTGAWVHYAFVRTETGIGRRFLNGESMGLTQFNQDVFMVDQSNDAPLWIGCEDFSGNFFGGRIDELRISSGERYTTSFETKDVGFVTDEETLALYHFDEASGEEIIDASGNGHHGLFHGNPAWMQESPIWTEDCEPEGGDDGPFAMGKNIFDEALESVTGPAPAGATSMTVSLWGAGGSGGHPGHGGGGGFLQASMTLLPGDAISITVGQGGVTVGGGGGASLATLNGELILIAGGGGGAGLDGCSGCSSDPPAGSGGGGGAYDGPGMAGLGVSYVEIIAAGGQGGGQDDGGAGGDVADGSDYEQVVCSGGKGSSLQGGAATQAPFEQDCGSATVADGPSGGSGFTNGAGGGGGSGYFGGGGGGGKWTYVGGGGGGGSTWAHAQASVLSSASGQVITPGAQDDLDYAAPAGAGGTGGTDGPPTLGSAGRIVVVFQ